MTRREGPETPRTRHWESQDFTVSKVVLQEGNLHQDLPRFGANLEVKLADISVSGITLSELTHDFFFSKFFNTNHSGQILLGDSDSEIDRCLEKCLSSMYPGERCQAAMRIHFDIQKNKREPVELKEVWVDIECQVHLESVLNAQPLDKWHAETKLEKAKEINEAAVRLFKTQRYLDAFYQFRSAMRLVVFVLEDKPEVAESLRKEAMDMKLSCYSNIAACQFQWKNFGYVIQIGGKVLEHQPQNVKMLYRRGVSYLERKEFPEAKSDLSEAHKLDPSNKAINDKLGQLRILEKKHTQHLANNMKKMFG
ncbi:hypothetical protein TCAL_09543 [Tigriopus californicus]|uniref:Uncharacterized protein n=1 Tax=Tigriopus californicus TaxID=6832 RepID=A0A553P492_TIGCA|nr:uncharacterized protein LOC131882963 isoform X2 [Tigriopus californicus]XP_059086242.1 uncharacterized protein LOC131882963 isoform X2 [Tigriopus californicus]TRY72504.1 hypothetical protein TCAL_09543 [Tigriopus californicus]|eukprot:TCALIF_09543-PA protein Name:"Similar to FKBP62 Peptidyl-prolyl cis-trans isomerase FKBP62 (Arabidopsis thaliana)" AED:0.13 eAED:0.13 QI:0/-1/0/1/-1/1/1/0/308